jgi:uncharacterized protein
MRILVAGSSGMIGTELRRQLRAAGHEVERLVRRQARTAHEHSWSPSAGIIDAGLIGSVDAVINLSGASLTKLPWTARYERELRTSRVQATRTLAEAMSKATTPPSVFLSGSAVGFYGNRPGEDLTEASVVGTGLLASITDDWERTAHLAPPATRVVTLRTGIVVGRGGAFTPLSLLTKFGLGARIGSGQQRWPWISLHDEVAAIVYLLDSSISGPVNLVGPTPASADAITRRLATAMRRPRWFAIPEKLLTLGLGTAADELLLSSQRVIPQKLMDDGFTFEHPTVEDAIRAVWPARGK